MAIGASGAIGLGSTLPGEFGGAADHKLSEYYRGGSLVPNIPANNGIPTSGTISLGNFYSSTDYTAMSAPSLSATSDTKKGASLSGNYTLTSASISCPQPSGGIGPYTYAWQQVSGTALTVTSASAAATTFSRSALGSDVTGVYRCKVTDSQGNVVYSNNVSIRFIHYDVHEAYIQSVSHTVNSGSTAVAQIALLRSGRTRKRVGSTYTEIGDWVVPNHSTVGDDFEIYLNNDDTGISGANSNVDAADPALSTWGTISGTKYAQEANATAGVTEVAGIRIRVRLRSGVGTNVQTYPIDKIVGLTAKVNAAPPPPPPPPPPLPPWSPPQQIN